MTLHDTEFGELRWDGNIGWWHGHAILPSGSSFALYIHVPSPDHAPTEPARHAFQMIARSEDAIRRYAASELLPIHNEEWNEGDPIDEAEFVRRLRPAAIQLFPDGYCEVSFEDDNMFWGHEVGVRIQRDGSFQEAVTQG